jgi:hypothetical protein
VSERNHFKWAYFNLFGNIGYGWMVCVCVSMCVYGKHFNFNFIWQSFLVAFCFCFLPIIIHKSLSYFIIYHYLNTIKFCDCDSLYFDVSLFSHEKPPKTNHYKSISKLFVDGFKQTWENIYDVFITHSQLLNIVEKIREYSSIFFYFYFDKHPHKAPWKEN